MNDQARLQHQRIRNHRIVLGIGVLLDVEIFLHRSLRIGQERPLGPDGRTELLQGVMVVGGDGDDLSVGHSDLRIVRGEFQMLLVFLRTVMAAGQRENQRVVTLQLAELSQRARVIGQLIVGKSFPERCQNAYANSFNQDGFQ